jgi:hypothetical protein
LLAVVLTVSTINWNREVLLLLLLLLHQPLVTGRFAKDAYQQECWCQNL